jgi:hypothetical protein
MRPESRRSKEKVKARAAQLGLVLDHLARPSRAQTKLPEELSVLAPDMAHLRDAAQGGQRSEHDLRLARGIRAADWRAKSGGQAPELLRRLGHVATIRQPPA